VPATLLRVQLSDEELLRHEPTRSTRPPHPVRPGQHRRASWWPSARSRPGCGRPLLRAPLVSS